MSSNQMAEAPHLPDEIIKEILSPALHVPDELFASTSARSSFSTFTHTSAAMLVVSKNWRRVGTTMLYQTVVLRSKAQAQALATTLENDELLGRFIKQIRIEGGYGSSVYEILKRSPNIQDLWLTFVPLMSRGVDGYAKGFHLINPRRLIIQDEDKNGYAVSTARREVYEGLTFAISNNWTQLHTVDIGIIAGYRTPYHLDHVLDGLATSKIEYLRITGTSYVSDEQVSLFKLPTLKEIRVVTTFKKPALEDLQRDSYHGWGIISVLKYNPSLYDKIKFERRQTYEGAQVNLQVTRSRNHRPLANASKEDKTLIWSRILRYAMALPPTKRPHASYYDIMDAEPQFGIFKAGLLRVSKEFYMIGLPLLYEVPAVRTKAIARRLADSPHKHFIKVLCLDLLEDEISYLGPKTTDIEDLVDGCSNLIAVSQSHTYRDIEYSFPPLSDTCWRSEVLQLPHSVFLSIVNSSADTLCDLHLPVPLNESDDLAEIFKALPRLRNLRSLIIGGFGSGKRRRVPAFSFPRDALPILERLAIGTQESSLSTRLLDALATADLPCICRLDLSDGSFSNSARIFLQAHGKKITTLRAVPAVPDLFSKLCPNVIYWSVAKPPGKFEFSSLSAIPKNNNVALTTIVVPDHYRFTEKDLLVLKDTNLSSLKNLQEVRLSSVSWPENEREIGKSLWVPPADSMVNRWKVKLRDGEGHAWTPRLQTKELRRRK